LDLGLGYASLLASVEEIDSGVGEEEIAAPTLPYQQPFF
jgi:hypothetical protein